ncbi:glycerol-3-phosphate responsive antiterminator [Streptomyces arenae]|nr:glycerol-3-phosphate responsive antiterminator [Streptomyces arenae]
MNSSLRSRPLDVRLATAFAEVPVVASIVGSQPLRQFLTAPAKVCILASFAVGQLPQVVPALRKAGKTVFVNVDSSPGLAQDRGALDFIKDMGASGVVSTRLALIEKGRPLGLLTAQKVFVTDRSNLRRSMDAISRGMPDLVEVMPAPIVARMTPQARRAMSPTVAAGFVETPADVAAALALGSVAAATSDHRLWHLRRDALPRPAAPGKPAEQAPDLAEKAPDLPAQAPEQQE